jgi:two-component system LytT family response regulator
MTGLRALIVDDDRISRMRLRQLQECVPGIQISGECADGQSALDALCTGSHDILFLDVNMPDMDGFALLEQLDPATQPIVVFVTSFDEHAVRAFETCALDYLVKPVSAERLLKTLGRIQARVSREEAPLPAPASTADEPTRFVVRSGGHTSFVSAGEIDWMEAAGNYAIFHVGRFNHMVRETLNSLETRLGGKGFVRVSRSAIVNLARIKEIFRSPDGLTSVVLESGQHVPMTRNSRELTELLSRM